MKLVVLKRSLLNEDFEQSWTIASKRNGEVKKVIDIVDYTMQSPTHEKWNPSSHKHQQGLDHDHILDRTPSHDSDGVSEISMQQSAFSSAFYPPTPSICSPDQVYSHKTKKLNLSSIDRAQLEERNVEEESVADAVAGSVIEFDQYSQMMAHSEEAQLLEEDSVELQSVSQSLSEKVLKSGDRSRYNKPIENTHAGTRVAEAVTGSVDLNNDQQAMMAMLLKLAQSPATSTLLSQLLLTQQLQSAAMISPPLSMPAMSTFAPPAAAAAASGPSVQLPLSVAPTHHTIPDASYYDTHPLSHAELTRRYLYAENEAFPSIRQPQFQDVGGYNEGKNNNFPVTINPDNCSRLTVIPSSVLNRQLRDEFSDSASVTSSHNSAIPSKSVPGGRETCLLELSGSYIDNNVLVQMAELRLEEATQEKRKVIAIEVAEANITSLQASIGQIFAPCADSSHDNDATSHTALQTQLNALRATVLEDSLKHLAVNGCLQLTQLDPSVNRFRCLTTLNLSGNRLRSLSGPLDLPILRSIDLSHNLLTSLDFLQLLTGLSSLNASNNRIVSLSLSINMLVAHSKCLAALDLSSNPVRHNLFSLS